MRQRIVRSQLKETVRKFTSLSLAIAICAAPLPSFANTGLTGFTVDPGPSPTAKPTGPLSLSTKKALAIPGGSVLCGIDDIFNGDFETATFALVTQLPGGSVSPGLTASITGGTLGVHIVSPLGGATISDTTADVSGTFTGPLNTGIAIDGVAGYVANGQFLVPNVPLGSGSNVLTATATILTGSTATDQVSVTQSGTGAPVSLSVDHPFDFSPALISFNYHIGALPSGFPVQLVTINFGGGGGNFSGSSLSGAPTQYKYTAPGLYAVSLSVTDTHSNTYTGYRSVLMQDLPTQRGMLCDVYGYLQSQLSIPNATGASLAFQPNMQSQYLSLFTAMGNSNLPTVGQQLGVIVAGMLGQGFADLLVDRDDTGSNIRTGFPLRLTQGADGVWRISEM
jgi:hypothetical protein